MLSMRILILTCEVHPAGSTNSIAYAATRAGGIPDVVRDGENGMLFNDGDIDGIAACLNTLLNDKTKREQLIARGRITAFEEYSIENTISGYEQLFHELIYGK